MAYFKPSFLIQLIRKIVDKELDLWLVIVLFAALLMTGCASYGWKVFSEGEIGPRESRPYDEASVGRDSIAVPPEAMIW